jgi:hypothetical protein
MADLTDIKPCPACGKRPELRAGWSFWIECVCGEESDGWTDIESAIRDWNESAGIASQGFNGRGDCEAGERCSCPPGDTRRQAGGCCYWKPRAVTHEAQKETPHG